MRTFVCHSELRCAFHCTCRQMTSRGSVQLSFSVSSGPLWSWTASKQQTVSTFLYSSEAVFNYLANEYKLNWEPEWRINVLTQFSCFSLNLQKAVCEKEVSDNQENNNIYLLIHRLYISWYNSDIILLAKIL